MKKSNIQFANASLSATLIGFYNEIKIGDDGWAMIAPYGDHPSEALMETADGKLKRQKAIQRINQATGDQMVAQFHNSRKGIRQFLRGVNIYVGHPDMPGLEKRYPDKTPKGVFADMETRDDGIYGLPVFTNEGMDLVEGRKLVDGKRVRGFSGRLINSVPDGELAGKPVYCPTEIASAGLTAYPHLPVHFFNSDDTLADCDDPTAASAAADDASMMAESTNTAAVHERAAQMHEAAAQKHQTAGNAEIMKRHQAKAAVHRAKMAMFTNSHLADANAEAATNKTKETMKKKLIALCATLGIQFANEADDAQTEAALDQVSTKVTAFATQHTSIKQKLLALCKKVGITFANEAEITDAAATLGQVEEKVVKLDTDLTAARTEFANERKARITDELGLALTAGRITAAQQPDWQRRLEVPAQFANELTAIRALTPVVKTASITLTRGGRTEQVDISDSRARAQFANEILGEIAKELKLNRTTNHNQIYAEAVRRHPALFEGMQHKEIKMPGRKKS